MNFIEGFLRKTIWNASFKSSKSVASCSRSLNLRTRVRLAAAYRAMDQYNLNEGISNHLSAKCPSSKGNGDVMLIIPMGQQWREVTPSSLIGINVKNEVVEGGGKPLLADLSIHRSVYKIRPDVKCAMHNHMPYTTALTCIEDPCLKMIHQNSTRFYNRIVYDPVYGGIGNNEEEADRIARALKDKDVLLMGNHGVLVVADSVDVAFDNMYYLERSAMIQVLAYSTNKAIKELDKRTVDMTSKQIWSSISENSKLHLDSFVRQFSSSCEEFKIFKQ